MRDSHPTEPETSASNGGPERPGPPAGGSSPVRVLRLTALAGTGAVVLWRLVSVASLGPRQEYAFAVFFVALLTVGVTLLAGLSAETRRLVRHNDLLVPLGLYVPAAALVDLLASVPVFAAVLTPSWALKFLAVSLSVSVLVVIQVVLGVLYAGWTTTLVLQAVREDRVDLVRAIADVRAWFLRVLAVLVLGWAVLLLGVAVVIPLGSGSIGLVLVLLAAGSLAWNLITAAVLPVAVAERGRLRTALAQGLRVSRSRIGRWWGVIVLQMVLLGWLTYVQVSYTTSSGPGSLTEHTRTSWHVHAFWTGGYPSDCHWHADLMAVVEAEPLPLVTTLLGLLFGVLAIAVKLRIAGAVYGRPSDPSGADAADGHVANAVPGDRPSAGPAAHPVGAGQSP